jgi:NAD(P) transhydrogenase subunit alpha
LNILSAPPEPKPTVILGVPKESAPGELRVALIPESVARLVKAGVTIHIERGAGLAAGFTDAAYEAAGAQLADAAALLSSADLVCKVQKPTPAEAAQLKQGAHLISLLAPSTSAESIAALDARGVTAFALELVPRITRAQSMDVLSSQATVAGYKAVLLGAAAAPKFLPMLTTAAGTIAPSKCCVLGAGVAGLQAIATARRLGAVVSGFDIRAAAAEQIRSLGASVVAQDLIAADSETAGGYAKEQTKEQQDAIQAALRDHLKGMDLVITTAQIPGRPAPRLISTETVRTMHPGAVIVDLAAESGGNCEATKAGETVDVGGVQVIGPVNLPASMPTHASQMLSRNILTFVQHLLTKEGTLNVDRADEITGAMIVTGRQTS